MSLRDDFKMLGDLGVTIKATLANDICSAQALDMAVDRNRVQKELIRALTERYVFTLKPKPLAEPTVTFQCPDCGDEEEITKTQLDTDGNPFCSDCGTEMD
jgi:predicted RNA-binding Zn-ribbon protein involved in translation (DUF1610 family)